MEVGGEGPWFYMGCASLEVVGDGELHSPSGSKEVPQNRRELFTGSNSC